MGLARRGPQCRLRPKAATHARPAAHAGATAGAAHAASCDTTEITTGQGTNHTPCRSHHTPRMPSCNRYCHARGGHSPCAGPQGRPWCTRAAAAGAAEGNEAAAAHAAGAMQGLVAVRPTCSTTDAVRMRLPTAAALLGHVGVGQAGHVAPPGPHKPSQAVFAGAVTAGGATACWGKGGVRAGRQGQLLPVSHPWRGRGVGGWASSCGTSNHPQPFSCGNGCEARASHGAQAAGA